MKPRKPKPQKKGTQKPRARELFLQGVPLADVAKRLNVSPRSVARWKAEDKGTPQDWDQAKLPADQAPKPNLISFDRARGEDKPRREKISFDIPNLSTLEGQLDAIDKLVGIAMNEAANPQSPQTFSSALNAVPKLLSERRAVLPIDKLALLMRVVELYRSPEDLLNDLKAQGFGGRKSA